MLSIILYDYYKNDIEASLKRLGVEYRLVFGPDSDSYGDIFKTVQLAIKPTPDGKPVKAIFNLYDGSDARGQMLTDMLATQPIPCTSSYGALYDVGRNDLKEVCNKTGVATPNHFFYYLSDHVDSIRVKLNQMKSKGVETIFIKPGRGFSSVGITKNSKQSLTIEDEAHWDMLVKMIQEMGDKFGSTLVEEFIDGKEISILILPPLHHGEEPVVFKPIEFNFKKSSLGTNFITGEDKLDHTENLYWYDDSIYSGVGWDKSMNYVKKIYKEFGFRSYVRFDIRIKETGGEGANDPSFECYVIDVNPGCAVFVPCTAVSILKANCKDNDWFLNHIVESAINHKNKN